MPIKGVSDVDHYPLLGKVRLGEKVQGERGTYPKATDHFIIPDILKPTLGDEPRQIIIQFPDALPGCSEEEVFARQWLQYWTLTHGLVCEGSGLLCRRKVDTETGDFAGVNTRQWEWRYEIPCDTQECHYYLRKRCRRHMCLTFLIPESDLLGVWQLHTGSFYSIIAVNGMFRLLNQMFGTACGYPLTLALVPKEVTPPGQGKKTIHILNIISHLTVKEVQSILSARKDLRRRIMLPPPPDTEEPPDDLFPPAVLMDEGPEDEGEQSKHPVEPPHPAIEKGGSGCPRNEEAASLGKGKLPMPEHDPAKTAFPEPVCPTDLDIMMEMDLGQDGWNTKVLPKMQELFGTTDFEKLDGPQRKLLYETIKSMLKQGQTNPEPPPPEKLKEEPKKEEARLSQPTGEVPGRHIQLPPQKRSTPRITSPGDLVEFEHLKQELGVVLKGKGLSKSESIVWLKQNYNAATRDELTLTQIRDAVARARALNCKLLTEEDGPPF